MISVIIPVYNEEDNLKKLLPHLYQIGKGHDFEVIISAGSCNGDYEKLMQHLPNAKCVKSGRKGRAQQMNDGVLASDGNVFVFLHADVVPPQSFFKDIEETLQSGFDAGFFSYRFDKDDFFLRINASFTKRDGIFTGGGDQCLFIKKSVFEKLGGFDEDQVLMEDFEFFKRMKSAGVQYSIIENDLIVSARKYERNSYLRVNLSNLLLVFLFKMGFPPKRLKSLHNRLLRLDYQNTSA